MPRLFPMFLKLEGRRVLVVGGDSVAEAKIADLLDTGARIKVVACETSEIVAKWACAGLIELEERGFIAGDLKGTDLVIVANSPPILSQIVFSEAQRQQVLCNVVDVPEQCDFFYSAIVKRGDLQIAISTSGQSPSLAQRLRRQLERQFGLTYAKWVAELGETRREILNSKLTPEQKQGLLKSLASREAFDAMVARNEIAEDAKQGVA
jgi:precorrin-2 dehydrogenase / sirohydrochlorin ferrochelatase